MADDDWNRWAIYVKQSIERLEKTQSDIYDKLNVISIDIAVLKTKASVAGAIGGALAAFVTSLVMWFITRKG